MSSLKEKAFNAPLPPSSRLAEQSVLGGLMLDNEAWDNVTEIVSEIDFYHPDHRLIYRAIERLCAKKQPVDVLTVSDQLEKTRELEQAGGLSYLGALAKDTPSAANISHYAAIVRDKSLLRRLIGASTKISNEAINNPEGCTVNEIIDNAQRVIFEIAEQKRHNQNYIMPMRTLLKSVIDKVENMVNSTSSMTGISSGFHSLDQITSGLQAGDLIVVAGRPSMGKTALALNIAEHIGIVEKSPVLIFSLEMPDEGLATRSISSLGQIDQNKLKSGKLSDTEWSRLANAIKVLADSQIAIDATSALTLTELRTRARREQREKGQLGAIIIDYLQLMQSPKSGDNRVQQISDISRGLKALAKELKVPVIALSQLNRNLEQRPNKRPIMSDLRESGSIEQDADLIVFIYRDEVYNPKSPDKGIAEIIIGKQRNGPIGTIKLRFEEAFTRFSNLP